MSKLFSDSTLSHYGIPGQKWGQRRWQYEDGRFNEEGKLRYFGSSKRKKSLSDIKKEVSGGVNNFNYSALIYGSLLVGSVIGGMYLYNKYGINNTVGKVGSNGIFKLNKQVKDIIQIKDNSLNMNVSNGKENCGSNAIGVMLNNLGVIDGDKYRTLTDYEYNITNKIFTDNADNIENIFKKCFINSDNINYFNKGNTSLFKLIKNNDLSNKTGFLYFNSYDPDNKNNQGLGHIIPITKGVVQELQNNPRKLNINKYIENSQYFYNKLSKLGFIDISQCDSIKLDFILSNELIKLKK